MDAVDGANSATMLAECANSPDVATRYCVAFCLYDCHQIFILIYGKQFC